ncbi:hypothetical protein A3A14_02405 [Candidatus Daviesbacteria bacterium RIFCSPLOWO2_01_FULL_43_38]|nr:MAG: hypothetical protein A2874_01810 [Candidatus Daviesbacteria bacterium RIFCSPHIGHO2_01_FULL_43_17]OGE34807.1 MAG: hypothetical protein A3E45_02425 [Candidatus Daviesbacteria bacterium RIFCSPHIGHO2_12_FULL_43_11]OGE64016.1 MAG: hypothetical protein A3A14_02405 [Candidatus Daviesbacteria bacterium RIFCSPLOWO2_01_FULL_43_38]OGE69159.1 MAG: hypothetical protein A3J21_02010 [Candidatus Daviesbacteria bacterium RIFCSPLOWO2_02_FULL_43_11]
MNSVARFFIAAFKNDLFMPGLLVLAYLIFIIIVRGSVPTSTELVATFGGLYAKYGYGIIFLSAALESLVVASFFVPGMVAIALGAVFARTGQVELPLVVIFAALGATSGYLMDFVLGSLGFSDIFKRLGYGGIIAKARKQLIHSRSGAWILGFAHPNVAAFLSLAAGTVGMNFFRFLTIASLSAFVWATIWGVAIYSIGDVVLTILTKYSFLLVIAIVAGLVLTRFFMKEEKE